MSVVEVVFGGWHRRADELVAPRRRIASVSGHDGGGVVGIGAKRSRVQERFTPHLNLPPSRGKRVMQRSVCAGMMVVWVRERWSGMLRRRGWLRADGGQPTPQHDRGSRRCAREWEQKRVVSRNGSPPSQSSPIKGEEGYAEVCLRGNDDGVGAGRWRGNDGGWVRVRGRGRGGR